MGMTNERFGRFGGQEAGASDGDGGSFGRVVRPRCEMTFLRLGTSVYPCSVGCDALNTTVSA